MHPYQQFIDGLVRVVEEAKQFPLGAWPPPPSVPAAPGAPTVLLFSPHPDDEAIIGGLPLRLRREAGMNIVNVAVTQGSDRARQAGRLHELSECCRYLGFDLIQTRENGLEGINLKARAQNPAQWTASVRRVAEILSEQGPSIIFFPHDDDWNSSHIGTHHLVVDALRELGPGFSCYTVETEFWGAMDDPNLMVESSEADVVDLITALSFHVGEVRRNPYHLRMPAWLMDNVRRGGELVGGQGGKAPDFMFGTLYRMARWQNLQMEPVLTSGRFLPKDEEVRALFEG